MRLIARVPLVPAFLAAPTHPTRDLFLVCDSVIQQSLIFSVRETIVSSEARLVVSRAEDAWAGRTDRAGQATKESRVYAVDLVGATSKERT